MYTLQKICTVIECKESVVLSPLLLIKDLLFDSRKIVQPESSLFFALQGIRDGHFFVADAYSKGVRSFVLSDLAFDKHPYPDANFLFVTDTLSALQSLATYHRHTFNKPVIGITGSNGKTVVKEWLTHLLSDRFHVYQSPKSYNSQIGVALSLWQLSAEHDIALIEAGISQSGEMDALASMIEPTIGVFTTIGQAHMEGFVSKEAKIMEKMKLFTHAEQLIFPKDRIDESYIPKQVNTFSWGTDASNSLSIQSLDSSISGKTSVLFTYDNTHHELLLPFADRASVENCITCIATLLVLGYAVEDIQSKILSLKPVEMRLELKLGKNNTSIIDDSYSNDLASLQIALEFLHQQQQHIHKTLILSEIHGLTGNSKMQSKLMTLLSKQNLHRLIYVGNKLNWEDYDFGYPVLCYPDTRQLLEATSELDFENESILIKGSRYYHLEDFSKLLVAKSHETKLEVNLKALENNLNVYRKLLPADVKLMAMVKAFSYGSGGVEVANILQYNHVDYLTVAFADEGVDLRAAGIKTPIMVMSPDENTFDILVKYNLEPEIYSFSILHSLLTYLETKKQTHFPIHIKVDTGMHRLGFLPDELPQLLKLVQSNALVRVQSVFSHMVAAGEESEHDFSMMQIEALKNFALKLERGLGYTIIKHIANTAAIVKWPAAHLDMVRLGIGLYGIDTTNSHLALEPVHTLKTTVTQIKQLDASQTIGYDRLGKLSRNSKIATVKIGYADGYNRQFGQGIGQMRIGDQLVPTIGNICMDMTMLDVTGVDVQEGDEVIVFPDINQAARSICTIAYELLVTISSRVKRIYFYE